MMVVEIVTVVMMVVVVIVVAPLNCELHKNRTCDFHLRILLLAQYFAWSRYLNASWLNVDFVEQLTFEIV